MGCNGSKYEKSPVGWEIVGSNHLYIKTVEMQHWNPPSTNPNIRSTDSSSLHTYIGNPVDMILQVVVAEGLWPFIDLFGAPRLSTHPPVGCLTLDARHTEPGGAPIKLSLHVLKAFFVMLISPNSQGLEVVKLVVQNIALRGVSDVLGQAIAHMSSLREVELFSNGLDDTAIKVIFLK